MKTDGNRTVSKPNDPGVKMMRKLDLGSDYICRHTKKMELYLLVTKLNLAPLSRTEQVKNCNCRESTSSQGFVSKS